MAGDIILITSRLLPDADQDIAGPAASVVLNQSVVTFNQGKGRIKVTWFLNPSAVGAGNVTDIRFVVGGTAPRTMTQDGRIDTLLLNGGSHTVLASCIVDDPAEDSFVRILVSTAGANSMRMVALNSVLIVELVPQAAEVGPQVRVAP